MIVVDITTHTYLTFTGTVLTVEVRRVKLEFFIGSINHPVGIPTYKTATTYNATYYYMV